MIPEKTQNSDVRNISSLQDSGVVYLKENKMLQVRILELESTLSCVKTQLNILIAEHPDQISATLVKNVQAIANSVNVRVTIEDISPQLNKKKRSTEGRLTRSKTANLSIDDDETEQIDIKSNTHHQIVFPPAIYTNPNLRKVKLEKDYNPVKMEPNFLLEEVKIDLKLSMSQKQRGNDEKKEVVRTRRERFAEKDIIVLRDDGQKLPSSNRPSTRHTPDVIFVKEASSTGSIINSQPLRGKSLSNYNLRSRATAVKKSSTCISTRKTRNTVTQYKEIQAQTKKVQDEVEELETDKENLAEEGKKQITLECKNGIEEDAIILDRCQKLVGQLSIVKQYINNPGNAASSSPTFVLNPNSPAQQQRVQTPIQDCEKKCKKNPLSPDIYNRMESVKRARRLDVTLEESESFSQFFVGWEASSVLTQLWDQSLSQVKGSQ